MSVNELVAKLADAIVNPLIKLMFAVALIVFLWGVFGYIKGANNADAREIGKSHIIWGFVGMFIMVSVFSIIKIVMNTVYG